MELSQEQKTNLFKLRLDWTMHSEAHLWPDHVVGDLLDIIDTLLATTPPPAPSEAPRLGYEWVQDHPDGPNWYPVPDYDPHEGEGEKEDGWSKCVVCQAFTIDPETGRCIHWDKDVEHHQFWYDSDGGAADDDD